MVLRKQFMNPTTQTSHPYDTRPMTWVNMVAEASSPKENGEPDLRIGSLISSLISYHDWL